MTALIILGVLAGLGIGGLVAACAFMGRTIHKLGNQLSANSDLQVERIKYETGADRIREELPDPPALRNGRYLGEPDPPDMSIPSHGG